MGDCIWLSIFSGRRWDEGRDKELIVLKGVSGRKDMKREEPSAGLRCFSRNEFANRANRRWPWGAVLAALFGYGALLYFPKYLIQRIRRVILTAIDFSSYFYHCHVCRHSIIPGDTIS